MGLLRKLFWQQKVSQSRRTLLPRCLFDRFWRRCRFELMESRQMLSVVPPIELGAVYFEDSSTHDQVGDVIEITFTGGAPGTQLANLQIHTDKYGDGMKMGDVLFDTADGGVGAFHSTPFTVVSWTGIGSVNATVEDGGMLLVLDFIGFDASEKFVFSIDVDEMGFSNPNAVAEGNEFEGSQLTGTFTAPHFYDATDGDVFLDAYDEKFSATGLNLPEDDYDPPSPYMPPGAAPGPVYTAGAIVTLGQKPLPITLAGNVYEDMNLNNQQEAGEPGIGGVTLTLIAMGEGLSITMGDTAVTDAAGYYQFEGLSPGTYRVVETQPAGYLSVGASPGTVESETRGVAETVDVLTGIALLGGDDSIENNFGERAPSSISGRVHADVNGDCLYDAGEPLLAGVVIHLRDEANNLVDTATTDALGEYQFSGLVQGTYRVEEVQPAGYLNGDSHVGSVGGTKASADLLVGIALPYGVDAVRYDFCEVLPASVSGYVYVDNNQNCKFDDNEQGIGGVTVELLDAEGKSAGRTAATNAQGFYIFSDLYPGIYGLAESHPAGYLDYCDTAGTVGGVAHNPGDLIDQIALVGGLSGEHYDFGEILPASIAGRVHAELDMDCIPDPGEPLLAGVTIYLLNEKGDPIAETATNEQGEYIFKDLPPGVYGVQEFQPPDYLDGRDHVGSAGGELDGNDRVILAKLGSGVNAVDYNFCEIVPAEVSGYVFLDGPAIEVQAGAPPPDIPALRDGKFTPDDAPLGGVILELCDGNGAPLLGPDGLPITAMTDNNGYYEFTMLMPGKYSVVEVQPEGYYPGIDTAGTHGGMVVNRYVVLSADMVGILQVDLEGSSIVHIELMPGDAAEQYNFSEVVVETVENPEQTQLGFPSGIPPDPPPPAPLFQPGSPMTAMGSPYVLPPMIWTTLPYGGSGGPEGYTWHLSILNGGRPRRDGDGSDFSIYPQGDVFDPSTWAGPTVNQAVFLIADASGTPRKKIRFGLPGAIPVTGDWNGDGVSEVGVFYEGHWFFDLDGNGVWEENDLWAKLGEATDQPVAGDWDGDGKADIGIFGPAWNGDRDALRYEPGLPDVQNPPKDRFKNVPPGTAEATTGWRTMKRTSAGPLRSDVIDHVFQYGSEGDKAVVGDWNGDGIATIGVFRGGTWFLDVNGDGKWNPGDVLAEFGQEDDVPVVGDWTGDGASKLGVYRNGTFYLDANHNRTLDAHDKVFTLGNPGDKPFAGDFSGDGVDTAGVYQDGTPVPAPTPAAAE